MLFKYMVKTSVPAMMISATNTLAVLVGGPLLQADPHQSPVIPENNLGLRKLPLERGSPAAEMMRQRCLPHRQLPQPPDSVSKQLGGGGQQDGKCAALSMAPPRCSGCPAI